MTWQFSTDSGKFVDPAGMTLCYGYSGHGDGVNNPDMENVPNVGPIPRGVYSIGEAVTHPVMGPLTMALTPGADTEIFGRAGFDIHGDTPSMDHSASHGCVILPHDVRATVAVSADRVLTVV